MVLTRWRTTGPYLGAFRLPHGISPTFFMSRWNVPILIVPLLVDPNQIHGETNCHNGSISSLYVEGKLGGYYDDDTIPSSLQLWHKMHSMWH